MNDQRQNENGEMSRRDFLGKVAVGSLIGAGSMAFIGTIQLPLPKVLNEPPSLFKIGYPSDFGVNTYKAIPEKNVFVLRDQTGFRALSAVCTHLGCIVSKMDWGFSCPCHGSKFDQQGNVTGGPAPKALEWLKIGQSPDGQLTIDLNKKVKPDDIYVV
ncbi:MAG: ubiquinol-cytochrome c reductase iron-sulfur subunit [bacterium]